MKAATSKEPKVLFYLTRIPDNEVFRRRNAEVTDGRGGVVKFVAEPDADFSARRGSVTAEVKHESYAADVGTGRRFRVRVMKGVELVESTTFELADRDNAFLWAAEKVAGHAI